MDELKIFYSGKDFFGYMDTMLTCVCFYPNERDIKKAVSQLKKDYYCAIHFENQDGVLVCVCWDNMEDYENGVAMIRESPEWNIANVKKVSFELAKKYIYQNMKQKTA